MKIIKAIIIKISMLNSKFFLAFFKHKFFSLHKVNTKNNFLMSSRWFFKVFLSFMHARVFVVWVCEISEHPQHFLNSRWAHSQSFHRTFMDWEFISRCENFFPHLFRVPLIHPHVYVCVFFHSQIFFYCFKSMKIIF